MVKLKKYWKILFIFVLAIAVRTYAFGDIPGGVNQDGAMAAVDAKYLSLYGTDRLGMFIPVHFTAWGFGQMSVLMSYLMIPFIKLFGLNTITMRLPVLLCSILGLIALYMLCVKAFSKKTALIILMFACINPWHIMQSRWALDCNMFPHFFLFAVLFLIYKKYVVSMLFFGLSMYCYGISIYCVPFFLIICCIHLVRTKQITIKKAVLYAVCYLAVAWPFILCMAINALGLETISLPFCTIPYFSDSIRSSDILFFSDNPLRQLWSNFVSLSKIILQISEDSPWNKIDGFESMYIFSSPFFIVGLYKLFKNFKKSSGASIISLWFITAVFSGLVTNNVNINRINIIFYPMIIITGIGIHFVICFIQKLRKPVMIAYIVAFSLFVFTYFTSYADTISYYFLEDFGDALEYASSLDAEKVYITPDSQMKGTWYVSEILAMYYCDDYSESKYSFFDKENADVLVVAEPEPGAVQFGRFYVIIR